MQVELFRDVALCLPPVTSKSNRTENPPVLPSHLYRVTAVALRHDADVVGAHLIFFRPRGAVLAEQLSLHT